MGNHIVGKKLKTAWLVQWGFYGSNEQKKLKNYGIENKIVDFFNSRKDFDFVSDYVKTIYRTRMLSFSEKMNLEDYMDGRKNIENMFGQRIPVSNHYKSELYRKLTRAYQKDINSKESIDLGKQWERYPQYIIVGHNPYLKAEKVYNLKVMGEGVLEWDEVQIDGGKITKKYLMKK